MSAQAQVRASTQDFLDIADIKDDLVILRDGGAALLIETSAVNFGLLSEEEQEAIIYAFAAFINSLSFPLQLSIISRRMDISSYLDSVAREEATQSSGKMRGQIRKYYQFILGVVKENRVLEKKFYLVIPFSSLELGVRGGLSGLGGKRGLPFPLEYILSRAKTSLFPKRDHILRQLNRLGLKGYQLTSQKLIELFYELFNPAQSQSQKVAEEGTTSAIIEGGK